ncbi:MAG: hypothetical protein AAB787_02670 [Patescibacteria group bacterium]
MDPNQPNTPVGMPPAGQVPQGGGQPAWTPPAVEEPAAPPAPGPVPTPQPEPVGTPPVGEPVEQPGGMPPTSPGY